MGLLYGGSNVDSIARTAHIAPTTVRAHIRSILQKLGCIPSWRHARCSAALVTTHADTHWNFGSDASSRKCPRHTRRDGVPPLIELDLRKDRQF
ncbi:LuxR C-terminal-related transcriptional regulator [Rhodococcus sp. 3Y1]